jgi:hypothetical protein
MTIDPQLVYTIEARAHARIADDLARLGTADAAADRARVHGAAARDRIAGRGARRRDDEFLAALVARRKPTTRSEQIHADV